MLGRQRRQATLDLRVPRDRLIPALSKPLQTSFGVAESLQHQRAQRRDARAHPGIEMRTSTLAGEISERPCCPRPLLPSLGHACEKAWHELIKLPLEHQCLLALRPQRGGRLLKPASQVIDLSGQFVGLSLQAAFELSPALQSLTKLGKAAHLEPIGRLFRRRQTG